MDKEKKELTPLQVWFRWAFWLSLILAAGFGWAHFRADNRRPENVSVTMQYPVAYEAAFQQANLRDNLPYADTLADAGAIKAVAQDFANPERFDVLELTSDCYDRESFDFPWNISCDAFLYGSVGGTIYYKELKAEVLTASEWPSGANSPGADYYLRNEELSGLVYTAEMQLHEQLAATTRVLMLLVLWVPAFVLAGLSVWAFGRLVQKKPKYWPVQHWLDE